MTNIELEDDLNYLPASEASYWDFALLQKENNRNVHGTNSPSLDLAGDCSAEPTVDESLLFEAASVDFFDFSQSPKRPRPEVFEEEAFPSKKPRISDSPGTFLRRNDPLAQPATVPEFPAFTDVLATNLPGTSAPPPSLSSDPGWNEEETDDTASRKVVLHRDMLCRSQKEVATILGFSTAKLSKLYKQSVGTRWPFRKWRQIERKISNLRDQIERGAATEDARAKLDLFIEERESLVGTPVTLELGC